MGSGESVTTTVGGTNYDTLAMEGSALASVTGEIFDCGTAQSACVGATGKICLIQRGTNSFTEKTQHCDKTDAFPYSVPIQF